DCPVCLSLGLSPGNPDYSPRYMIFYLKELLSPRLTLRLLISRPDQQGKISLLSSPGRHRADRAGTLFLNPRSVWDCKGTNLFHSTKKNVFFYFSPNKAPNKQPPKTKKTLSMYDRFIPFLPSGLQK